MYGLDLMSRVNKRVAAAACLYLAMSPAAFSQANGDIKIDVTNEGNSDFFLTPVWFGFHNGAFDLFNPGEAVSSSLEALAEDGITSGLTADFTAAPGVPGDIQGVVFGNDSAPPPINPGETGTAFVTPINPAGYQFFSFASMVIPSNDTFIGNSDPFAYQVFNSAGEINDASGTFTIQVFGDRLYDAGTEENDALGAAFSAAGGIATDTIGGVATLNPDLSNFLNTGTAAGTTISDLIEPGELLATITVTVVPEPASASLIGISLAALALRRRRAVR